MQDEIFQDPFGQDEIFQDPFGAIQNILFIYIN